MNNLYFWSKSVTIQEAVNAQEWPHVPVMLEETLTLLDAGSGIYIDGTLGAGGHAEAFLERMTGKGQDILLIGIDRDSEVLEHARARLARFGEAFRAWHGSFSELDRTLQKESRKDVRGILLDLGMSSYQLSVKERGFSYRENGYLDMRFDRTCGKTAAELLSELSESEIERILREYGEEKKARFIAREIVKRRTSKPLETSYELAAIARKAYGKGYHGFLDPAARSFMALRILVNDELGELEEGLQVAGRTLAPGGRLVVISFHSLEDRIVKNFMRGVVSPCVCPPEFPVCACGRKPLFRYAVKGPLRPSAEEIERNPRSRSAKLRSIERLDVD